MADKYNIHAAKSSLSRLVDRAAAGEDIILARAGKPVARITALEPERLSRKPGLLKGSIKISRDFDSPLDDESLWADGAVEPK